MVENELELLRKFKEIIKVSKEVKKTEIARYLGISEELLFEKLVKWGQHIPFKIKLDSIEIDNVIIKSYRGTLLESHEYYFMMELDNKLGEIPPVSEITPETFGFKALDNHIVQLSLYNKNLTSLPDSIGNLTLLTYLNLTDNQLTSLPDSIGKLTSLESLFLDNNQLTSLVRHSKALICS